MAQVHLPNRPTIGLDYNPSLPTASGSPGSSPSKPPTRRGRSGTVTSTTGSISGSGSHSHSHSHSYSSRPALATSSSQGSLLTSTSPSSATSYTTPGSGISSNTPTLRKAPSSNDINSVGSSKVPLKRSTSRHFHGNPSPTGPPSVPLPPTPVSATSEHGKGWYPLRKGSTTDGRRESSTGGTTSPRARGQFVPMTGTGITGEAGEVFVSPPPTPGLLPGSGRTTPNGIFWGANGGRGSGSSDSGGLGSSPADRHRSNGYGQGSTGGLAEHGATWHGNTSAGRNRDSIGDAETESLYDGAGSTGSHEEHILNERLRMTESVLFEDNLEDLRNMPTPNELLSSKQIKRQRSSSRDPHSSMTYPTTFNPINRSTSDFGLHQSTSTTSLHNGQHDIATSRSSTSLTKSGRTSDVQAQYASYGRQRNSLDSLASDHEDSLMDHRATSGNFSNTNQRPASRSASGNAAPSSSDHGNDFAPANEGSSGRGSGSTTNRAMDRMMSESPIDNVDMRIPGSSLPAATGLPRPRTKSKPMAGAARASSTTPASRKGSLQAGSGDSDKENIAVRTSPSTSRAASPSTTTKAPVRTPAGKTAGKAASTPPSATLVGTPSAKTSPLLGKGKGKAVVGVAAATNPKSSPASGKSANVDFPSDNDDSEFGVAPAARVAALRNRTTTGVSISSPSAGARHRATASFSSSRGAHSRDASIDGGSGTEGKRTSGTTPPTARARAVTGNMKKKPVAARPAPARRVTRPRSQSASSVDLIPPWSADAPPLMYRTAGGTLLSGPNPNPPANGEGVEAQGVGAEVQRTWDDVVLPAVAKQIEQKRLMDMDPRLSRVDGLISQWNPDGTPRAQFVVKVGDKRHSRRNSAPIDGVPKVQGESDNADEAEADQSTQDEMEEPPTSPTRRDRSNHAVGKRPISAFGMEQKELPDFAPPPLPNQPARSSSSSKTAADAPKMNGVAPDAGAGAPSVVASKAEPDEKVSAEKLSKKGKKAGKDDAEKAGCCSCTIM